MSKVLLRDITVIEAIPDRILPELLPFIIQNDDLFDFAVGKSAGSLSPLISATDELVKSQFIGFAKSKDFTDYATSHRRCA